MTFGEKLKTLRSDRGLTQDELAEILFVSRTAISKWESSRGFPNIDSLKAISKYFSVSIDDLLSADELVTLAEDEQKQNQMQIKDTIFGLIDLCIALLLFLPFFAQNVNDVIEEVSLISLSEVQLYLKILYFAFVLCSVLTGVLTLALKNCTCPLWNKTKTNISLLCGAFGVAIFIISRQPYAAVFVFAFLIIKALMLIKRK